MLMTQCVSPSKATLWRGDRSSPESIGRQHFTSLARVFNIGKGHLCENRRRCVRPRQIRTTTAAPFVATQVVSIPLGRLSNMACVQAIPEAGSCKLDGAIVEALH